MSIYWDVSVVIYLDSSALLDLLHDEPESEALADWLVARAGARS